MIATTYILADSEIKIITTAIFVGIWVIGAIFSALRKKAETPSVPRPWEPMRRPPPIPNQQEGTWQPQGSTTGPSSVAKPRPKRKQKFANTKILTPAAPAVFVAPPPEEAPPVVAAPRVDATPPRVLAMLGGRSDVRRAVLMAEVLSRPVSLREENEVPRGY